MNPEQAREFRRARQEAHEAAERVLQRIRERRFRLYEAHRSLLRIRDGATRRLKLNPDDELGWKGLECFYRQWVWVHAELAFWEYGPTGDRIALLEGAEPQRREKLGAIIRAGGFVDREGKWVEVP